MHSTAAKLLTFTLSVLSSSATSDGERVRKAGANGRGQWLWIDMLIYSPEGLVK